MLPTEPCKWGSPSSPTSHLRSIARCPRSSTATPLLRLALPGCTLLTGACSTQRRQLLVAVTRTRAEVLNTGDDIGTLESGKFADIVACDGNPAIETRATAWNRFVMQSGRVVRFDAKD